MSKNNRVAKKKLNVIIQSANLFFRRGYVNTGLNEILEVCKIPKGSFYYYFKNKDDLLIHIIEYHTNKIVKLFDNTVDDLSIYKLKSFFSKFLNTIAIIEENQEIEQKEENTKEGILFKVEYNNNSKFYGGSPLGNLNSEMSNLSDEINKKIIESFSIIEQKIFFFFQVLSFTNNKYKSSKIDFYTHVLVDMLEGTCLKLKREKNDDAIEEFLNFFDIIILKIKEDN